MALALFLLSERTRVTSITSLNYARKTLWQIWWCQTTLNLLCIFSCCQTSEKSPDLLTQEVAQEWSYLFWYKYYYLNCENNNSYFRVVGYLFEFFYKMFQLYYYIQYSYFTLVHITWPKNLKKIEHKMNEIEHCFSYILFCLNFRIK